MKSTAPTLIIIAGLLIAVAAKPGILISMSSMLAEIGVGASVPPNGINTYAEQLDQRARELDTREAKIAADESRTAVWLALGIIGGLVAVNFILDWRRNRG